jgi:ribosomal protein S18 acetylase RimI-like enzyme
MITHQIISYQTVAQLLKDSIDKDQHLLFYSYVTQRKEQAQFFGQFIDSELTAVMAYFSGMSFPAFSFYRIVDYEVYFSELLIYTRNYLAIKKDITCGTILSSLDLELFKKQGLIINTPKHFLTMKHYDQSCLLECNSLEKVRKSDFPKVIQLLQEGRMQYFSKEELERYPFLGIKQDGDFIALGGFHFYDSQLVELGNIVTRPDFRGKGLAKMLTSQLTYLGKELAEDIYLGVLADNIPALRLYEGLGYQITAEQFIVEFTLPKS